MSKGEKFVFHGRNDELLKVSEHERGMIESER